MQRVAERRPVALILPARIGHHPIEIIEHARDEQAQVALRRRQRRIDGQAYLPMRWAMMVSLSPIVSPSSTM